MSSANSERRFRDMSQWIFDDEFNVIVRHVHSQSPVLVSTRDLDIKPYSTSSRDRLLHIDVRS